MNTVVQRVETRDEADLVQGALLQSLVFRSGFLGDEAGRDISDIFTHLFWNSQDVLELKLVTLCLKKIETLFVVLRSPYFERGRACLFPEGKGGPVRTFLIFEPFSQIFIERREISCVNPQEAAFLSLCENVRVHSYF